MNEYNPVDFIIPNKLLEKCFDNLKRSTEKKNLQDFPFNFKNYIPHKLKVYIIITPLQSNLLHNHEKTIVIGQTIHRVIGR